MPMPQSYEQAGRRCENCRNCALYSVPGSHISGFLCFALVAPKDYENSAEFYAEHAVSPDGWCEIWQHSVSQVVTRQKEETNVR